jgi:hypothetical protein
MWTLDLAYTGSSFTSATALSSIGMKKPDDSTLPLADTEGIAGNLDGSFFVSHEGLAAGVDATYSIPPWIARFNGTTGNKEADVALPVKFLPRDGSGNPVAPSASNQSSGVVSNLSLECLGITPSKKVLFTANEAALKQDYNGTYDGSTNQAQNSLTRMGACGDGVGAARPRRPTGAKLGARRSKDGLDQDDPATVKQPHALRLSTLRLSSLFLFIVAEEHDKSVVPP